MRKKGEYAIKMRKGNFILAIVVFLCIAAIFTGVCFLPYTDMEPNDTGRDMTKSTTIFKLQDETNITNFLKSEKSNADSVVITDSKGWIYKKGDIDDPVDIGSCKNAIVSALYGIAVQKGLIDINQTLEEIEFDDPKQPLTETEKQAKISYLLQGRSGIYLYAVGDEEVDLTKPERGAYAPGEYYYHQNWDINALGRIFEKLVQKTLGDAFYQWVAIPTQMKYFSPANVDYDNEKDKTLISGFNFWMTGDDLARFAVMYLNGGKYLGEQIIESSWIENSFVDYTQQTRGKNQDLGYGYLWWTHADRKLAMVYGDGGQMIIVNKERDIAIVITNNTGAHLGEIIFGPLFEDEVTLEEAYTLYELALTAKQNA